MTIDAEAAGLPARRPARDGAVRFAVGVAGSAVLGALAGLLWGEVAPRALLQQVGAGEAAIVNAETRAFMGADVWFCAIAAVAGLITGVLGYRFLVARPDSAAGAPAGHGHRAAAAAGLIIGAVVGALVMMWVGGQIGLGAYNHMLATSPAGTTFDSSLSLGAKSGLAFWPLLTSIVIMVAEWSARRAEPEPVPPPTAQGPFGYPAPPA